MTRTGCAVAVLVLAALAAPAAEAKVFEVVQGVNYFSDHAWDNQLDDGLLAQFPKGCEVDPATCHFTIWLDFLEGVPDSEVCVDDPLTRWPECRPEDQCIVWVEFGEPVLPLSDRFHGRILELPDRPVATNQVLMIALQDDLPGWDTVPLAQGQSEFHGVNTETLRVLAGEVAIHDTDLCRVGVAALYYLNSKTLFDRGYLLPREARTP